MRALFRDFMTRPGPRAGTPEPRTQASGVASLIVGLGNPGKEYAQNRHNVGFWCVNQIAREAEAEFAQRSSLASVAEGNVAHKRVAMAKPRTFVNRSGDAVRELLRRYRLEPVNLIVVCDDLDLGLGSMRIRERGGHGGHNGLRSIIGAIGSEDFPRIRIGIGRPSIAGVPTRDPERIATYVLGDPTLAERRELDARVSDAVEAVRIVLSGDVAGAMGRFNIVRES